MELRFSLELIFIQMLTPAFLSSEPHLHSNVLELSDRFLEFKGEGHWFVEFYAPWCGHCKKLQPVWEQVANILAEKAPIIKVGRLDCARFTGVAQDLDVHGFPTIKYFRDGAAISFEGDRTREALLEFALNLEGPEVRKLYTKDDFMRLHDEHYIKGGFFVLVVGPGDNNTLQHDFAEVAKNLFSKARFAEATPEILPQNISLTDLPAVFTCKDSMYHFFAPAKNLTLKQWVDSERWSIMPMLTYGNLYDMGLCCDKLLVIVVSHMVDRTKSNSPVKKFHDLAKETAKFFHEDFGGDFQFCWTDGNEIGNRITVKTLDIPSFLVYNASSYHYYLPQDHSEHTTKESLALFLKNVADGQIQAYGGKGLVQNVKRSFFEIYVTIYVSAFHWNMFAAQPLLSCCLFGLPLGILSIICYTLCSADMSADRDKVYKESDDEEEDLDENDADVTRNSFRDHNKYD